MTKSKILLSLLLIIVLISSCCYATEGDAILLTSTDATPEVTTLDSSSQNDTTSALVDDILNNDLYKIDEKVVVDGIIDGNAFVIGKEVTVTGEIGGDLFIIAEKVNIDGGYVYSSLFVLAQEIDFNGIVYDLYAACNEFNLKENGIVYRDLRVAGNDINISGRVRRNVYATGNNLNLAANSGTLIYGNLEYSSNQEDFTAPEGVVKGEVKYTQESVDVKTVSVSEVIGSYVKDFLQNILFTFVVVMLLIWLAPNFIEKLSKMSVGKSFACLGIGILAPIVLIIAAILLLIIQIGSPVFFSGLFGYIFLSTLGFAIASIFFTKLLSKKVKMEGKVKFVLFTLLIAAGLWIVDQLPFISGLVSFLAWAFGTGAILVNMIPNKNKKAEENK